MELKPIIYLPEDGKIRIFYNPNGWPTKTETKYLQGIGIEDGSVVDPVYDEWCFEGATHWFELESI